MEKKILTFSTWNADGLSGEKYAELEEHHYKTGEINIIAVQETHHQGKILNMSKGIKGFCKVRKGNKNQKKGGGLQFLLNKNKNIELTETRINSTEIQIIEGKVFGTTIKMINTYLDVSRDQTGKDNNKKIRKEIEKEIENNQNEGLIIAGDFNGHLHVLDEKEDDTNGLMINKWSEEYDLHILNLDQRCKGTYTRIRNDQKTTVDYILVNKKIFDMVEEIEIDEDRQIMDGSDHVVMHTKINMGYGRKKWNKPEWKIKEYISDNQEDINNLADYIEGKWTIESPNNPENMLVEIAKHVEEKLSRKTKRRIGIENGIKVAENIWMTNEIRQGIKLRKEYNRRKRNATSGKNKEDLEKLYKNQKYKVQRLIREAKINHEKKLTEEIKKDKSGKKMWEHIEKLTDKKERANKGTEMYDTNSKIMSETEARKGIKETWNEIYKTGKKDLTPIYSGDWKEADIGKTYNEYQEKRRKDREEKEIEWIEAKKPKYNEEKLKKGLKRLKVGKTAGPDKTKAEVYQALGKKERCKLVLIENLDKIIEEKDIPNSWKKNKSKNDPKKKQTTTKRSKTHSYNKYIL